MAPSTMNHDHEIAVSRQRLRGAMRCVHAVHLHAGTGTTVAEQFAGDIGVALHAVMVEIGTLSIEQAGHAQGGQHTGWVCHALHRDIAHGTIQHGLGSAIQQGVPIPHLAALLRSRTPIATTLTARCTDHLTPAQWDQCELVRTCLAPDALRDALVSVRPLNGRPGHFGVIHLFRDAAQSGFDECDREILHELHEVVGDWFWGIVAGRVVVDTRAPGVAEALSRLTPAQKSVLPYLLAGETEAEIARRIFRSRYTVHDHARAIYSALSVRNRVELVLKLSQNSFPGANFQQSPLAPNSNPISPQTAIAQSPGPQIVTRVDPMGVSNRSPAGIPHTLVNPPAATPAANPDAPPGGPPAASASNAPPGHLAQQPPTKLPPLGDSVQE